MEKRLKIRIQLESPTLVGSGEGFGSLIDSDIVFDEIGLPYIPAKRIKGCLRDSITEVQDILNSVETANLSIPSKIELIFGKTGAEEPAQVYFSNLYIREYEQNRTWLRYFLESDNFKSQVTRESIQVQFTEIRQMTKVSENGVAFDNSLRSVRLIKRGEIFEGDVYIIGSSESNEAIIQTLNLACMNFRRMGTNRNRGFGEISCILDTGNEKIKMPEALCIS